MTTLSLLNAAAGATGEQTYIEDVFSTYLYTGNGTSQNINNGIDLGGLPVARVVATFYGGATTYSYNADAGDILVGYVLGTTTSPSLSLNGSSKTAKSTLTDSYSYKNSVFIEPLVAGSNSFTVGNIDLGYGTLIVIRGASSVTVGKNITEWSGSSATTSSYASTGYGLLLTSDRDPSATPTISNSYTVADNTYTYFKSRFFAVNGDGTNVPSQTVTGLVATQIGAYCGISVVGLGVSVPQAEPGEGGMVWIKGRSGATDNALYDTNRGTTKDIVSNTTAAETTQSTGLTAFNSNGFGIASLAKLNSNTATYASWTFRKAPKFFDVVTWTGNGVNGRTISHSLGTTPGMVIVKRTSAAANWCVYHRSTGASAALFLDSSNAVNAPNSLWNYTSPTSTAFTVGSDIYVNGSGDTYVAYLFAHDTDTDGLIQCGSFTTDGSGNATVNLGWEPQYVMVKNTTSTGNWFVVDSMRGMPVSGICNFLLPNTSGAESSGYVLSPTATGFGVTTYAASQTYIYMAIRRGPMRTPTDGTKVFKPVAGVGTNTSVTTNFTVDMQIAAGRVNDSRNQGVTDRLRGYPTSTSTTTTAVYLQTSSTAAEANRIPAAYKFDNNVGFTTATLFGATEGVYYNFQRAPGFFDVVCYTGTGVVQNNNHSLGVAPELMIVKYRASSANWFVYNKDLGSTKGLYLNLTSTPITSTSLWNNTEPTTSVFTLGTSSSVNTSGGTYVAYLFASCPGVSKVGSYTGTGATQTISCGFTGGARFVLIKRTDSTGDWYVWDTARGMVSGTDPRLAFNLTAAETNANWVYTTTGGFQIVTTDASVNASGGSYIYLAVA